MKKFGRLIKVVGFLIICSMCLGGVSNLLQYEHEMEPNLSMNEYYKLDKNSAQMIILGSSHTTMGFSPIECYKQTGITSFNLSTAKQPIEVSYFLLKEALKRQSPEVVVYEVSGLYYQQEEINIAKYRYSMDTMPLSINKIWMAESYARYNEENDFPLFSIGEALCPIYYYHDRWKEMNEDEFSYLGSPVTYLKGQVIRSYITKINFDMEAFDKKLAKKVAKNPSKQPTIRKNNLNFFLKIKKLCDDNNIKLVLTSTPTNRWNSAKEKLANDLAEKYNLDFVNMSVEDGKVIDYSLDMADGNHVNARGVKKTTKYLTDFIVKNYGIKSKGKDSQFEECIKYYDKYYNNMLRYDMETDFNAYMKLLNENKKDLTIFITGKGDITTGLNSNDVKQLKALGLKSNFDESNLKQSYIAVIDGGKVAYEKANDDELLYKYNLTENSYAELYSNGSESKAKASTIMDEREYAINSAGLNIVLYDKESGCMVDSVAFATHDSEKKWWRSGERSLELYMFKTYRNWVAENN